MPAPLLICAAVEEELAALLPSLAAGPDGWRGSVGGREVIALPVGIGPVEAALGSAAALACRPSAAIFLGTCGAFPGTGIEIGEAVVIERSVLTASDAAAGLSYVPAPAQRIARADDRLCRALARRELRRVGAATVVAITRDGERALQLREATGCETEHLEAHAFLRAAEIAGVPAACLLGVANEVGPSAHEQWKAHGTEAARSAVEALVRWAAL